jgi:hypothetical protein
MSRFSDNLIAGMRLGSAMRTNKRDDEKHKYEISEAEDKKQKRDHQKKGDLELVNFLQGQKHSSPSTVSTPSSPMANGIGIRDNPNNQNEVAIPLQEGGESTSPVAQGTTVSNPQNQASQGQFSIPDIDSARGRLYEADQLTTRYPHLKERIDGWKANYAKAAMFQHQQGFTGDYSTNEGLQAYKRHMALGAAKLGNIMTPEQAKANNDYIKSLQKEGYQESLDKIKAGDVEGANEIWNSSGKLRGTITNVRDDNSFKIGGVPIPGKSFDVIDDKGQIVASYNTSQLDFQAQAFTEQVDSMMKGDKHKTDKKKVNADIDNMKADNAREDKKFERDSVSIVQGADDQFLVNKNPASMGATALGIGKKPSKGKGGSSGGRTNSELMAMKKNATTIFDKSINVSNGQFGLQGLKKEDGDLYATATKYMYSLIEEDGLTDGKAAKSAKDFADRAFKYKEAGKENYTQLAMRDLESIKKGRNKTNTNDANSDDHSSLWK